MVGLLLISLRGEDEVMVNYGKFVKHQHMRGTAFWHVRNEQIVGWIFKGVNFRTRRLLRRVLFTRRLLSETGAVPELELTRQSAAGNHLAIARDAKILLQTGTPATCTIAR